MFLDLRSAGINIQVRQKRKTLILVLMLAIWLSSIAGRSEGCTIFFLNGSDRQIVAKNHDFMAPDGFLIANKRNLSKTALVYLGQQPIKPAQWTSKFGSVTQNQYGRELPYGGINEAGLVVEMLMMPQTIYPTQSKTPTISQLQWVQYQLDNYAGVREVLENLDKIKIRQTPKAPGLHYFIADRTGDCIIVEFINGQITLSQGDSIPYKLLTNSPYSQCLDSLKNGHPPKKDGWQSDERFIQTAKILETFDPNQTDAALEFAFATLNQIKWQAPNQWTLAYDLTNRRIYFRPKNAKFLRFINLDRLDFNCATPVQAINIDGDIQGDAADAIIEYNSQLNRDLIKSTLSSFSLGPEASSAVFNHRTRYLEEAIQCRK